MADLQFGYPLSDRTSAAHSVVRALSVRTRLIGVLLLVPLLLGCGGEPYQSIPEPQANVRAVLQSPLKGPIARGSLVQILSRLESDYGLKCRIEENELSTRKISELEVALNASEIPLEDALTLLLWQIDCNYYLEDGELVVAAAQQASIHVTSQAYDLSDLVQKRPPTGAELEARTDPTDNIFTSPAPPVDILRQVQLELRQSMWLTAADAVNSFDPEELAQALRGIAWEIDTNTIKQPSPYKLEAYDNVLLVTHNEQVHRRIRQVLELMRALRDPSQSPGAALTAGMTAAEQHLDDVLQQRVDWKIPEQYTLEDFAAELRTRYGINVIMDERRFAARRGRRDDNPPCGAEFFGLLPDHTLRNMRLWDVIDLVTKAADRRAEVTLGVVLLTFDDTPFPETPLRAYAWPWNGPIPRDWYDSKHLAHSGWISPDADAVGATTIFLPRGIITAGNHESQESYRQAFAQLLRGMDVSNADYDPRPPGLELRTLDDALDSIVDVDIQNRPLGEALRELCTQHGVDNLVADWRLLSTAYLATDFWDETVTLKAQGGTLRSALNRLLDFPANSETFRVIRGDNYVLISKADAEFPLEFRAYRVGSFRGLPVDEFASNMTQLTKAGWVEEGTGSGIIQGFADLLLVGQPEESHREIADILELTQRLADLAEADQLVLLPRRTPAREKIDAALATRVSWEMPADYTPLTLIDRVREQFAINVDLDRKYVSRSRYDPEAFLYQAPAPPSSLKLQDMTLREVLLEYLRGFECGLVIKDDELLVTDIGVTGDQLLLRGYPGPWISPDKGVAGADDFSVQLTDINSGMEQGWLDEGTGMGTSWGTPGGALVTQTGSAHAAIEDVLTQTRALSGFSAPAESSSARVARLEAKLDELVDVDLQGLTLEEALNQLQTEHQVLNFHFDWAGLAAAADHDASSLRRMLLDAQLTLKLQRVPLRTAFELLVMDAIEHLARAPENFIAGHPIPLLLVDASERGVSFTPRDDDEATVLSHRVYDLSPRLRSEAQRCWHPFMEEVELSVGDNWNRQGTGLAQIFQFGPGQILLSQNSLGHREFSRLLEILEAAQPPSTQGALLVPQPESLELRRILDTPLNVEIDDLPLDEAFLQLCHQAGVTNLFINRNGLRAMFQKPLDEFRVSLHGPQTSLRTALDQLVSQANGVGYGEYRRTTWEIYHGVLHLGAAENMFGNGAETRVYVLPASLADGINRWQPNDLFDATTDAWLETGTGTGQVAQFGRILVIPRGVKFQREVAEYFQKLMPELLLDPSLPGSLPADVPLRAPNAQEGKR